MSTLSISREEFDALRSEVESLRKQLAAIAATDVQFDEETLYVLAAAVAAFLGKRATIKLIRRVNEDEAGGWVSHGRTSISASHQLTQTRGW